MIFNKKTQIWYFDFVMGVTIFTLILIVAFRFVTSDLYIPGKETSVILTEARRLSEILLTPGIPANWSEDLVLIPGIIDEGNVLNIIKLEKLINMTNKSSNKVKQLFGIKSDFLVYLEDSDNNILWSFDNLLMGGGSLTNNGVQIYYTFDNAEVSGSTVVDVTENNNGTILGASSGATGKIGDAIAFDGSGDNVKSQVDSGLTGDSSFTMNCWFWDNRTAASAAVYSFYGLGDDNDACGLSHLVHHTSNDDKYYGHLRGGCGNGDWSTNAYVIYGEWHMLTFSHDSVSDEYYMYVNGALNETFDLGANINMNAEPWTIGDHPNIFSSYLSFLGTIDECGLWNRSLSESEISDLYNSGNGLQYPFTVSSSASINDVKALNPEKIITLNRYLVYKHDGISEIVAMKVVLWQE